MSVFQEKVKIGVLGGGQLGLMLLQAAIDWNLHVKILENDTEAPCASIAPEFVKGSLQDFETVLAFGQDCEIITIEIEKVNIEALEALEKQGKKVFPQPSVLRVIQDKRIQKQFYKENGIPTADFVLTENAEDARKHESFLPAFHKLGKDGYDGKGVQRIASSADFEKLFDAPSLLEKAVDFEKELAVIVARNENGEVCTFPTVEMVFHPEVNLVEFLFAPANISAEIDQKAKGIALKTAQSLNIVGLLAVEMFLTKSGEILVNEVAPRPHNSGHHTIRANFTSQYEQHWRSILGLPLGDTTAYCTSAMLNLLGAEGHIGNAVYEGMDLILGKPGIYPFLYGKKITKPFRKMGHITLTANSLEELYSMADFVKQNVKVVSSKF